MLTTKKMPKFLCFGLVWILILLAGIVIQPVDASAQSNCWCVTYVVNELFGGPRSGNWPTAASMASDVYWNQDDVSPHRYNPGWAKAGDVVIFQPGDEIYWYNEIAEEWWSHTFNSDGHIGFVEYADYISPGEDGLTGKGGWFIQIRHSNWDYIDEEKFTEGSCNNVSVTWFYVPNWTATSWWRVY